jgi:TonB-linked SusC/RagA family outer membrane protein
MHEQKHYCREKYKFFSGKLITMLILISSLLLINIQHSRAEGKNLQDDASSGTLPQQGIVVSGRITDGETSEPLPGVNIIEEGTTNGVISDLQGRYTITVRDANSVLNFSFIGYANQIITVNTQRTIDVALSVSQQELEEIVVIGYGVQKKISVTASVSTIDAEDIIRSPVSSVQNALAGRATGLIAVQRSGAPGADFADIYIRGRATYGNSSPLILVDGIERDITTIDPNEIQSINILKDASATAVYGVRGANGVIVVTTRTGHLSTKPTITFSANYGLSSPIRVPRFLESHEWAEFYNQGLFNDKLSDANGDGIINGADVQLLSETYANSKVFSDEDIALYKSGEDPVFHPNTDWYKLLVRENVPQEQYNLNITGGTQKAKYFVSVGYFHQTGSFAGIQFYDDIPSNGDVKRYNIRANTDFNWTKNFSTSVKFSTQITNGLNTNIQAGASEMLNNVFTNSPLGPPPIVDGKLIESTPELDVYRTGGNPIFLFGRSYNINYQARTTIDLTSVYRLDAITKGLSLRGKFAYDNYYSQSSTRSRSVETHEVRRNAPGHDGDYYLIVPMQFSGPFSANEDYDQNYRLYGEGALDYGRTFSGGHTVSGLALGTMERSYRGQGLPFNYLGIVSRVTYNYQNKYMAEVNMGYNGSENFMKGKQFGFFPSFSLGYILSEENFFPENNYLTFVKFRGSYGKVGNDRIGGSRFLYTPSSYSRTNANYRFGDSFALTPGGYYVEDKIGNPDVTWEVATKSNAGLELKFLKNQLSFSTDLFKERREGILGSYNNLPFTFGDLRLLPSYNLGIVDNHGYEFEAGYRNSNDKAVQFWINANYTFARNKIIYNDEIPPAFDYLARTGLPIGQPFMLVADGLYNTWEEVHDPNRVPTLWDAAAPPQPGDVRYIDQNGDGIIDANDERAVGYSNIPEIVYGLTTGIRWKGFDINILIQGADHVNTLYGNRTIFAAAFGARTEAAYHAWTQEKYDNGEEILFPRISLLNSGSQSTVASTLLNQDASYIRLKNVEVGFTIPNKYSSKAGISSFRIYANGQNLATISKMKYWDPEIVRNANQQYPISRIINFGFRAQF